MGESAPINGGTQAVFLEVGAWCGDSNDDAIWTYGATCSAASGNMFKVTNALEWYMHGAEVHAIASLPGVQVRPTTAEQQTFLIVATTSNSADHANNASTAGTNWSTAIYDEMFEYATVLNDFNFRNGYPVRFGVLGGADMEEQWSPQTAPLQFAQGFGNGQPLDFIDNGYYANSCASSTCWNTADTYGWTAHIKYDIDWNLPNDYGMPQIYNTSWPAPYNDLDLAAESAGTTAVSWAGTFWGCGVGGSEHSPDQAWADFANATGQRVGLSTSMDNEDHTCR